MPLVSFENVGIRGLAAAVPSTIINNYEYTQYFDKESVREIVEKTGIKERRFASKDVCASDLCFAAAEKLFADLSVNRNEIDLLIFISQTADYRMPATSVLLQNRLGLSKQTAAFDLNLGCSAFVYGLSVAFSMMQTGGFRKALVLDGETRSRVYSPKDRKTAFLFGDGGVAALIERDVKYGKSFFSLNSDGSKESLIKVNAGGYRNPTTVETLTEKVVDEHGNIRSEEHGYMNGADVFNFVLVEIPKDLKKLFAFAGQEPLGLDYYLFHQANSYMNDYLKNKLKLADDKVPTSIERFGNTSSVSIPLTIATALQGKLNEEKKVLLSGFGVGMSWASAIMTFKDCHISDLVEVP